METLKVVCRFLPILTRQHRAPRQGCCPHSRKTLAPGKFTWQGEVSPLFCLHVRGGLSPKNLISSWKGRTRGFPSCAAARHDDLYFFVLLYTSSQKCYNYLYQETFTVQYSEYTWLPQLYISLWQLTQLTPSVQH